MKKLILLCLVYFTIPAYAQVDVSLFENLKPRNIGPAGMSGRVTAFAMPAGQHDIIYTGTAAGGIFKSTSGGTSWTPIFDKEKAASIGSIAVDKSNPNVIWVGTGEGNTRNSMNAGYGVYRSIDAGATWEHMGLENTRNIHRIIIHPNDPNTIWVGAIGSPWGEHPEKGVFKTSDGGKTWRKTLYINDRTGTADLVLDPSNPNKLMVAMWEHRRWPWFFKSGGSGSGLYISHDGGENWEQKTADDGLPKGELGRMGLAFAPSNSQVAYAWVESSENALYRSNDGGTTWKRTSKKGDRWLGNRPFYYAEIYVDPSNENRVYSLYTYVSVSEDGGKTFERFVDPNFLHVDNHALLIDPEDPDFMLLGNDGGMAISRDKGGSWRFCENLPIGQFYHISVDNEHPYRIYGGMQDNGSWSGPSAVWKQGGIRNMFWERIGTGDGFEAMADPIDSRYGYSSSQRGNVHRYDRVTGERKNIQPMHPDGKPLRFNWNAGFNIDPHDKKTFYLGAQYLLKTKDYGENWTVISPDLSTNDPSKLDQVNTGGLSFDNTGAENHCTITVVEPSVHEKDLLYVGTDDGKVHITKNGGESWTDLTANIKGIPEGIWVAQLKISSHNPAEVVAVFEDHRRNDWTPQVYRSTNYGKTWKRLVDETDVWGYTLSFVQDPVEPNLMFLGTEFGLYVSFDAGEKWQKYTHGFPTTPVQDLVIHPREHDLVIGTFGRAIWVLDDIRPLREMCTDPTLKNRLSMFTPPDATMAMIGQNQGYRSTGHAFFAAENRPFGAMITYHLDEIKEDETLQLQISNQAGEVVRTLYPEAKAGIQRIVWRYESDGIRYPGSGKTKVGKAAPRGASVLPGTYNLELTYGESKASQKVNLLPDPRVDFDRKGQEEKLAFVKNVEQVVGFITMAVDTLDATKSSVEAISKMAKKQGKTDLAKAAKEVITQITELRELIIPKTVQGNRNEPHVLSYNYNILRRKLQDTWKPVDQSQRLALKRLDTKAKEVLPKVEYFFNNELRSFKQKVDETKLDWW